MMIRGPKSQGNNNCSREDDVLLVASSPKDTYFDETAANTNPPVPTDAGRSKKRLVIFIYFLAACNVMLLGFNVTLGIIWSSRGNGGSQEENQNKECTQSTPPTPFPNATTLEPGDIHIVAFAMDSPDAFAFVTWVDISAGTEIYFTDKGWDCNGLSTTDETSIKYTAPMNIKPGSVQSYYKSGPTSSSPGFCVVSGSTQFSGSGDQLIVYQYQGTNSDLTPINAFDATGGWENCDEVDGERRSEHSALPPGLYDGVSAVSFDHKDNYWYRPWYSRSATLTTLKQWMVDSKRFRMYDTKRDEYEVPKSFTILSSGTVGTSGYTEYIEGNAPCAIISGHDGDLYPESISSRTHGCLDANGACNWTKNCDNPDPVQCRAGLTNDENTQDMARRAVDIFEELTVGYRCHLVINRLGRIKLDPNRNIEEAAQFDDVAIQAYSEFHRFIEQARGKITATCGKGLVVDFHGHAHPEERIEIGYLITPGQLRNSDENLDTLAYTSSIKNLPTITGKSLSELIRGEDSMGGLFERPTNLNSSGYESVPSPTVNAPALGEVYFQGGYSVERHGSQYNGTIDAIQIEFPRYLRAGNWEMQEDLLRALGEYILPQFLQDHYLFTDLGNCTM